MYTLLIIITLQLLPSGVVKHTTEELLLTKNQVCLSEMDGVNHYYDNINKDKSIKLLSVACSTKGSI